MPKRLQWIPHFSVGNDALDEQHREILARCNALADCVGDDSAESDQKFRSILDELVAYGRDHFALESELLAASAYPELDEHTHEREEFGYLSSDIVTRENFDKDEIQVYLALFWTGHIVESASKHRSFLARPTQTE